MLTFAHADADIKNIIILAHIQSSQKSFKSILSFYFWLNVEKGFERTLSEVWIK